MTRVEVRHASVKETRNVLQECVRWKKIPRIIISIDLPWGKFVFTTPQVLIPLFQTVIDKVILGILGSSDQDLTCAEETLNWGAPHKVDELPAIYLSLCNKCQPLRKTLHGSCVLTSSKYFKQKISREMSI